MKNSTKILVGITLSIMLMGGAYATWTDGLIVKADVGTYSFEGEIITIDSSGGRQIDEINDSLKATATFKIKDSSPEVKVKNTGTIPIYIEEVRVNYVPNYKMGNENNYMDIQQIIFNETGNDGSTDKRLDIALSDLFDGTTLGGDVVLVGKEYFKIEPEPRESGKEDESERAIVWSRELSLDNLTSEWDSEIVELQTEIDSLGVRIKTAAEDADTSGDKQRIVQLKERLQEIKSIISDITEAYKQDEIEIEFYFRMAK